MPGAFASLSIPEEDEGLRGPVREFLSSALKDRPLAARSRSWLGFDAEFTRALAERGWVGLTLPRAYGGGGRSHYARFVVIEELITAGAPVAAHWFAERQIGPSILRFGSDAQKARLIPAICAGQAFFCAGMSEPDVGSDLASVRTRAVRTPDGWRLNGAKLWTTFADRAHYMLALVRTGKEPKARHAGLSQLVVDMSAPGVTVRSIRDLAGDSHFGEVHFDDVLLPPDALLGEEGEGWAQVTAELALERSGPERIYSCAVLIQEWLDFVRRRGGVTDEERELAGHLVAQLATLRHLSLAVIGRVQSGADPAFEAAMVKDLGTAFEQSVPEAVADRLAGQEEAAGAQLLAAVDYLTSMAPAFSLRGGTREIMRGIIARGLGLR